MRDLVTSGATSTLSGVSWLSLKGAGRACKSWMHDKRTTKPKLNSCQYVGKLQRGTASWIPSISACKALCLQPMRAYHVRRQSLSFRWSTRMVIVSTLFKPWRPFEAPDRRKDVSAPERISLLKSPTRRRDS